MTLSVCMIVRDEEATLARCLDCVKKFADEIIIVDTGSVDSTLNIASGYTDKIFRYPWQDDFSAARNYSFSKASCELVMWLDADDVVEQSDIQGILSLKSEMGQYDMAFLDYAVSFRFGKPELIFPRERIFRRSESWIWEGCVHESISPHGRILRSDVRICHRKIKSNPSMRNLKIYLSMKSSGKPLSPRDNYYYGRELYYNNMYAECIATLTEFVNGEGNALDKREACIIICRAFYALNRREEGIEWALKSFLYSTVSGEACCITGEYLFYRGELEGAKYWFLRATECPVNGFCPVDCTGYRPYMWLCVVCYAMGDKTLAREYNERAGKIYPQDKSYLLNKSLLEGET